MSPGIHRAANNKGSTRRKVLLHRFGRAVDTRTVRRLGAVILVAFVAAGCGSSGGLVVHADGRIGPFRLDRTTEAEVRAKLGKPDEVIPKMDPAMTAPHGGRTIVYLCGKDCRTEYSFNNDTRALSDFWTQSSEWRTERGSHPGMPVKQAAEREGKKFRPGCSGDTVYIRSDRHRAYVLVAWKDKVDTITYLGPHSTYYDGLC
jgi:hypothetical protein